MEDLYKNKIKGKKELIETIKSLKEQGKKIVHCHGCFDLIHPGHIRHLRFAKEQGDILLVTITADKFVQKDYTNPFATQSLRAKSLASIEYVDLVHINENLLGTDIIREIKPDIYIKGEEYAKDKKLHYGFIEEKKLVESFGGKIAYSPGSIIFSSTKIINKLLQREDIKKEKINNFLIRHGISKENLINIIEKCKDMKILIIGDFFVEDYIFCDKSEIATDSPILNFDFSENKSFLGGVGLVAQYIQNLGGDTKILCIGNEKSSEIFNQLNPDLKNKIDFTKIDNYFLPTKTTFLSDEQKILELNKKPRIKLDEKTELDFINKSINLLNGFQAIIFCDYNHGFLNENIINSVTEEAKKSGVLCTLITGGERFRNLLNYKDLDFIICSEKEARCAVNNFSDGIDFLSRDLLSKTTYKNLVINLGKNGFICYKPVQDPHQLSSTYASYLPCFSDKIIDKIGVKEALISAVVLSLASKSDIYTALYLGNCISSIESLRMGNAPVSKEELILYLENE